VSRRHRFSSAKVARLVRAAMHIFALDNANAVFTHANIGASSAKQRTDELNRAIASFAESIRAVRDALSHVAKTLGETSRPAEDSWQPEQPRYVDLPGDRWVDLETRALLKTPPLAPGSARRVYDRELRQRGVHAVRADGAELTGPAGGQLGPLRWRRGK